MKRIGDLLSDLFDEGTIQQAERYNNLFSSWRDIAGENIAAHSRIVELNKSILEIEADHPGWIQILQTKQKYLLNGVCRKYPELEIHGISFRLSRSGPPEDLKQPFPDQAGGITPREEPLREVSPDAYERMEDSSLKASLKRIEQEIAHRNKARAKQ
ncbi:MAG: DUF721 domain-containing protein [Treponema sp.]|nr:DUF721 domain-containing protein [Treponema sp.]